VHETVVVGSLEALGLLIQSGELLELNETTDVVIVPTAAAFTGVTQAAIELSLLFESSGAKVEALMNADRASNDEPYFAERVRSADLVVLSDGSPLHAKSVWHGSALGEAIRDARRLVAIGSVGSVLGEVMIDPRGGAPTTGLGYRSGLVVTVSESAEQLARTRTLLGAEETLAVLGPLGVVSFDGSRWRTRSDDVVATRAHEVVAL
jgi:hypothetical protein